MDIAALRALIPATDEMVYLNTGWTGPSPTPVLERTAEVARRESQLGPASPDWLQEATAVEEGARIAAARLLGCDPSDLLMTHGTTAGIRIALFGYPWQPGDELVVCDLEHPAISGAAAVLAERYGVVLRTARVPPDAAPRVALEAIAAELSDATRVVALSHIQYSCGLRMPIAQVAGLVHAAGAVLVVDGAQSVGHIAVDIRQTDADFYAFSGQKWLLGPSGTGALYVTARGQSAIEPVFSLRPQQIGSPTGAENSEGALQRHGLASLNTPLLAGFTEAVQLATAAGPAAVEGRTVALGTRLREALATAPRVRIVGPLLNPGACGLTSVQVPGWQPAALVDALWTRYRIAARSVRVPPAVRFSTACFNTEEEVDGAVNALMELAHTPPPTE